MNKTQPTREKILSCENFIENHFSDKNFFDLLNYTTNFMAKSKIINIS